MLLALNDFTPTERSLIQRCRQVSRWCGAAVVAIGTAMMALWVLQPALPAAFDGLWLMKFNAAMSAAVCGIALVFHAERPTGWRHAALRALVCGAGLLAAVTLVEYATGFSAGIDALVVSDPSGATFPGRMAPQTAVAFLLVVAGLLLSRRRAGAGSYVCDGAIVAMVLLLHVVISGYVYHDLPLIGISSSIRMSPAAVAAHVVLVIGLICARADVGLARILSGDGRGSVVIRWLLPPVALLPIAVGIVRIWGEGAGLQAFAALFGAAQSMLRIAVIVGMGYLLNRSEALRKAEQARREEAERMVAMCAWTQRVRWNGEWVPVDEFLRERFGLEITHGISDDALADELDVVEETRRARKDAA